MIFIHRSYEYKVGFTHSFIFLVVDLIFSTPGQISALFCMPIGGLCAEISKEVIRDELIAEFNLTPVYYRPTL